MEGGREDGRERVGSMLIIMGGGEVWGCAMSLA